MSQFKHDSYDVIVVGAGPAGSSAAYFLSKQFERVLLLDRAKFPREKLCGGLLAYDVLQHLAQYWSIMDASELGISYQAGKLHYNKEVVATVINEDVKFNMSMREEFDMMLVAKTVIEGVEFHDGSRVSNILSNENIITCEGVDLKYDILVAADGIPSFTSKYFGLSHQVKNDLTQSTAFAYEIHVPVSDIQNKEIMEMPWIFFGEIEGYAWTFPKNDFLTVGVGAIGGNNELRIHLEDLFKFLKLDITKYKVKGHYIPWGKPKTKLYTNNCFLVGDAANICDPVTAKGIGYALESGRYVADAIKTTKDLGKAGKKYEKLIYNNITKDIKYGLRIGWFLRKDRTLRLGMHVLKNSESVSSKTMALVAGTLTFKQYWWNIVRKLPKYGIQMIFRKLLRK